MQTRQVVKKMVGASRATTAAVPLAITHSPKSVATAIIWLSCWGLTSGSISWGDFLMTCRTTQVGRHHASKPPHTRSLWHYAPTASHDAHAADQKMVQVLLLKCLLSTDGLTDSPLCTAATACHPRPLSRSQRSIRAGRGRWVWAPGQAAGAPSE